MLPQWLHRVIADGITRLDENPHQQGQEDAELALYCRSDTFNMPPIDRRNAQYFINYLERNPHLTTLSLSNIRFSEIPDGGVRLLRDYIANDDSNLTKVIMRGYWYFGPDEEMLRLFTAFQTTASVTTLIVSGLGFRSATLMRECLPGILQNTHLQKLNWENHHFLGIEYTSSVIRTIQPNLGANRTLKSLDLSFNGIDDDGFHMIADSLDGNEIMEALDMSSNELTSASRAHVTRLLHSMRRLKEFRFTPEDHFGRLTRVFADMDESEVQHFLRILHQNTSIVELMELEDHFSGAVENVLIRNRCFKNAKSLLLPHPETGTSTARVVGLESGVWLEAITNFARAAPDQQDGVVAAAGAAAGATAIFHLFQERATLLEQRPPPPPHEQVVLRTRVNSTDGSYIANNNEDENSSSDDDDDEADASASPSAAGQERRDHQRDERSANVDGSTLVRGRKRPRENENDD